jgi:hypothetical protein
MYKVFVNDKPILLSDQALSHSEYEIYLFKDTRFEEIVHKLQNTNTSGIYLYHNDLDVLWNKFLSYFEIVTAAGGLVINSQNQMLFIRRNERWDLPKGRMEIGETCRETAVREVEEECAIAPLEIIAELPISYHVYQENSQNKLKKTHWFVMKTASSITPIPQTEEGITAAVYVSQNQIFSYYPEMYANIQDIVNEYLKALN